jgi:1-acyl-sn-glycerol-3-phosphate acyltransferase
MRLRRFFQRPAQLLLRLFGWQIVGSPPDLRKYILIGAPHTTNLDGVLLLLAATALQYRINFLMKDSLFRGPLGAVARAVGGIAIDRSKSNNTVETIARIFQEREELVLAIAPEGTRKHMPYWRSGFYHIALAADVPIVLAFADYEQRIVGFGPVLHPTGNVTEDMNLIREFYADKTACYPEKVGPIVLRSELPDAQE